MAEQKSAGKRARDLNDTIAYTMWSVFKVSDRLPVDGRDAIADDLGALIDQLAGKGVQTRGLYDVSGPVST